MKEIKLNICQIVQLKCIFKPWGSDDILVHYECVKFIHWVIYENIIRIPPDFEHSINLQLSRAIIH